MQSTLALERAKPAAAQRTVREIYLAHGSYVWLTLQRMGVREADLDDIAQEVFMVVHQRLDRFDGSARLTTWLFGICLRVVANYRRRAYVRRERPTAEVPEERAMEPGAGEGDVEERVALAQARARLDAILATLPPVQRAVLVMFEVEEMSCEAIALAVGVPVGTVYSRLHAARRAFSAAVEAGGAR